MFHEALLSFPQLCSQQSLPCSTGLLSSWCCSRVRKGTDIMWEIVPVLTGLWTLRECKKSHLSQVESWWLHRNLIIRTSMVWYPDCQCSKTWRRRSVWQPGRVGWSNGRGFAVMESECPKFKFWLYHLIAALSWASDLSSLKHQFLMVMIEITTLTECLPHTWHW